MIFLILLFIGFKCQKVSEYYYYKVYYMLYIFLMVLSFRAIVILLTKRKKIMIAIFIIYYIGFTLSIALDVNLLFFDIYKTNFNNVMYEASIVTAKETEILNYYNKNIGFYGPEEDTYIYKTTHGRSLWIFALTVNPYVFSDSGEGDPEEGLDRFIHTEKNRCIILKRNYGPGYEKIHEDIEKNNLNILFENEDGVILEKN